MFVSPMIAQISGGWFGVNITSLSCLLEGVGHWHVSCENIILKKIQFKISARG
jgi:hypothetical protein